MENNIVFCHPRNSPVIIAIYAICILKTGLFFHWLYAYLLYPERDIVLVSSHRYCSFYFSGALFYIYLYMRSY
jgi:hypothetical protein